MYRLRGHLLPIVYLNRELQLEQLCAPTEPITGSVDDALNIVVLQAGDRQFGVVVDRINDTQEIVVKPLSKQLKGLSVFAGATIMGDGRVALILDVLGLYCCVVIIFIANFFVLHYIHTSMDCFSIEWSGDKS